MIGHYAKIGTMTNGKSYYFNVPYNSSEKFINYVSDEHDGLASGLFGYDRDKIVSTMYAVQFHIEDYEGWCPDTFDNEEYKEYKIHYHMMSSEGYENCYHPVLHGTDKKDLVFSTPQDACNFLIKFMEENEIVDVNTKEIEKDVNYTTKEVKRHMSILNRIMEAMNYE